MSGSPAGPTGNKIEAAMVAEEVQLTGLDGPPVHVPAEGVPKTYVEQQAMLDPTQPKGLNYYWKNEFVPGLADGFLETFRDHAALLSPARNG